MTDSRSKSEMWQGRPALTTVGAKRPKVCLCKDPLPIEDPDLGRYCFRCTRRLPAKVAA